MNGKLLLRLHTHRHTHEHEHTHIQHVNSLFTKCDAWRIIRRPDSLTDIARRVCVCQRCHTISLQCINDDLNHFMASYVVHTLIKFIAHITCTTRSYVCVCEPWCEERSRFFLHRDKIENLFRDIRACGRGSGDGYMYMYIFGMHTYMKIECHCHTSRCDMRAFYGMNRMRIQTHNMPSYTYF